MNNIQKRISLLTIVAVLSVSQACFAGEVCDMEQTESMLIDENGRDENIEEMGVVCLDSETDNSVIVPTVQANTYVDGVKINIRNLFSGVGGINGYRSNNKSIATCMKNGVLKGKKTGTVVIEAYDSSKTTVSSVEIHVVKQKLSFPKSITATSVNAADYLTDSNFPPSEWISSKPSVAAVNPTTGLITINGNGKTKISAIYRVNGSTRKITGTLTVKNASSNSFELDGKHTVTVETEQGNKTVKVSYQASDAGKVFDLVNEYRRNNNLPVFEKNKELQKAADLRAVELVKSFSHERPNGTMCDCVFPDYTAAAENIAMGQKSASEVMNSWKNSPGHNANMLNDSCTCLAVSCVSYKGTKYWVQCFIRPRD